jgi:S1-C subfamily serine protease
MIPDIENAYVTAVEKATRSIVTVSQTREFGHPWARRRGVGSGVIMDSAGNVLTNAHVIDGAEQVIVTLSDGQVVGAAVIGRDEDSDVAVVRIEAEGIAPAEFGDSDRLRLGQPVIALGHPLGMAGGPTVTSGLISSLHRSLQLGADDGFKVVQTDAAVNPGNSGGALADLQGRVVALTTAAIPWAESIGFAIPINTALDVARQIVTHGKVMRPWLGIVGYDVSRRLAAHHGLSSSSGVLVLELAPGSPAHAAGVRAGDIILAVGDRPLADSGDLLETLRGRSVGEVVEVTVDRSGSRAKLKTTLGTRP